MNVGHHGHGRPPRPWAGTRTKADGALKARTAALARARAPCLFRAIRAIAGAEHEKDQDGESEDLQHRHRGGVLCPEDPMHQFAGEDEESAGM